MEAVVSEKKHLKMDSKALVDVNYARTDGRIENRALMSRRRDKNEN